MISGRGLDKIEYKSEEEFDHPGQRKTSVLKPQFLCRILKLASNGCGGKHFLFNIVLLGLNARAMGAGLCLPRGAAD